MNAIDKFLIRLFNNKVGVDEFGNEYYLSKDRKKRYVVYKGIVEATKIPSEWHVWMHYTSDKTPSSFKVKKFFWQKNHLPNLTGTSLAYKPNNDQKIAKKSYESWSPNQ